MAYAINFRNRAYLAPGLLLITGDYSCTNGDATTLTVPSGNPVVAVFTDANQNVITTQVLSAKALGNPTTYTITSSATVASGGFQILVSGS